MTGVTKLPYRPYRCCDNAPPWYTGQLVYYPCPNRAEYNVEWEEPRWFLRFLKPKRKTRLLCLVHARRFCEVLDIDTEPINA